MEQKFLYAALDANAQDPLFAQIETPTRKPGLELVCQALVKSYSQHDIDTVMHWSKMGNPIRVADTIDPQDVDKEVHKYVAAAKKGMQQLEQTVQVAFKAAEDKQWIKTAGLYQCKHCLDPRRLAEYRVQQRRSKDEPPLVQIRCNNPDMPACPGYRH